MRPLSIAFILSFGCWSAVSAAPGMARVRPAERQAAATINASSLRAHIRFLSHDLLEGRGPGSRGDALTQAYIATRLEALGFEPGAPGGGWTQPFDIVGVTSTPPETLVVRGPSEGQIELKLSEDYVAVSGVQEPEVRIKDAEIVFVGYGIVAPEYDWDDYKGADLKGKVLLMMNNDPEDNPRVFAGKTRLYYGRWTYKYEMAAKVGAAGALIIHTVPSAGYPWQVVQTGWSGEGFQLPASGERVAPLQAWTTEAAARRLVELAGKDLDSLRKTALTRDFRPVPLGVALDIHLRNKIQKKQTANVIGRWPGSDPEVREEAVLYTAHHDHLGLKADAKPGEDAIYNGALDNASGVAAMLCVAEALAALPEAPRRSVLIAAVAAEEQGLLGSAYLARNLPLPSGRVAANINIDGLNVIGRTRDLTMVGLGKSSLDDYVKALTAMQGRTIVPDQFPDRGFFYRSDQFNLAKIGVPAAYFDAGTNVIGKPPGWGKEQQERFEAEDYHQPSDELRDDWDLSGGVEDARLYFYLGLKVANAEKMPAWKPGDEFEAARKAALAALKP